jgi:PPP family 3-phenylpropionic acid transporter
MNSCRVTRSLLASDAGMACLALPLSAPFEHAETLPWFARRPSSGLQTVPPAIRSCGRNGSERTSRSTLPAVGRFRHQLRGADDLNWNGYRFRPVPLHPVVKSYRVAMPKSRGQAIEDGGQGVGWVTPLSGFVLLYAVLYASFGVVSPFLPAFIEMRGISAEQIGLIFAAGTAIRLVSAPLAGRLADRFGMRREILAVCAVAAAVGALLYLPASGLWFILLASLFQAIALAPLAPLADALALLAANRSRGGFEYGWVRGTGSAAFIAGSIVVGWVASSGSLAIILWLQAALLAIVPLAIRLVPEGTACPPKERSITKESVKALLHVPVFRRVVLVAALILGSHAMHDTFAVIRWSAAGISPQTASLLWSISVAAEVVVFFLIGPALLQRLGPAGAIALAAFAGAVRWSIAMVTVDLFALALTQPLHGITFALLHLACMRLLVLSVPQQLAATAQAIYGTVGIGAATALLTLASGWLYARLGSAAFGIMSLLCLAALPLAAGLRQAKETEQVS